MDISFYINASLPPNINAQYTTPIFCILPFPPPPLRGSTKAILSPLPFSKKILKYYFKTPKQAPSKYSGKEKRIPNISLYKKL